jgi:hypothetical protein
MIKYFNDNNIYFKSDEEINKNKLITKTKMYLNDYKNYASFINPYKDLLYIDKLNWREEQQIKEVIGKNYEFTS